MALLEIATPQNFSLRETVESHGWHQLLPFRWDREAGVLERLEEFPEGQVARLRLSETEAGRLVVEGTEGVEEADITARVRRILQLDLALEEFYAF